MRLLSELLDAASEITLDDLIAAIGVVFAVIAIAIAAVAMAPVAIPA